MLCTQILFRSVRGHPGRLPTAAVSLRPLSSLGISSCKPADAGLRGMRSCEACDHAGPASLAIMRDVPGLR